jgi:hypothetical protein
MKTELTPTPVLEIVTNTPLPNMDGMVYDMSISELDMLMRSLQRDYNNLPPGHRDREQVGANINLVRNRMARLRGKQ